MFVSLNKKIIYSIITFFLITSIIFVYTFYKVYGNKIQEEQLINIQRNQQYIDLLYKNINLNKELRRIEKENKNIHISKEALLMMPSSTSEEKQMNQLTAEQRNIAEISKNYDERYTAIQESLKIFGISSVLILLAIILLAYLITRWILTPINKIAAVSQKVSEGDLSSRINREHSPLFTDELDYLIITFNQMLNNLQNVISEVKDKEKFLQALIDSIPDGIRVIDKDYNIIIANKAYYRQIGKAQKSCHKCYEASQRLKNPCDPLTTHCPLHEILVNRQSNIKVVQQFCGHPERHLAINAAPLNYNTREKYIVESIRDLSEDINFSHQQKLSSLGFLSTSIAHEMKNHLGALRIITERLLDKFYKDKSDEDEDKKHLLLIYNELINCIAVPERLLKLSRTNSDDNQQINCSAALSDVLSLLDFEAKSKGINIIFDDLCPDGLIRGNEADFKMAAINIILNALKATEANGTLTISISQPHKKHINISFEDTGTGISPENLSRIFDPFFTEGGENRQKGNGLGLSITKSIVEKFGGTISVVSELGRGSCFTLSFPPIKNLAKK